MNQESNRNDGWEKKTQPQPTPKTKKSFSTTQDGSLPYFGVVVGRVANRISGAAFSLPDGTEVKLPANDNGRHCLHGGTVGWDKREWSDEGQGAGASSSSDAADAAGTPRRSSALLSLLSEDGDQGFPGNVRATVLYELLPGGRALR